MECYGCKFLVLGGEAHPVGRGCVDLRGYLRCRKALMDLRMDMPLVLDGMIRTRLAPADRWGGTLWIRLDAARLDVGCPCGKPGGSLDPALRALLLETGVLTQVLLDEVAARAAQQAFEAGVDGVAEGLDNAPEPEDDPGCQGGADPLADE